MIDNFMIDGWKIEEALLLCRDIEKHAPIFGCHVALTGGCLYKDGERKDLDLLFYRIRQCKKIDHDGLFGALETRLGIKKVSGWGWCVKADCFGRKIDMFFPEELPGPNATSEY